MIPRLEDQIERTTRACGRSRGPPWSQVIDRPAWIRANISSFQHLLAPVLDEWSAKMPIERRRSHGISGQLVGAELGALLGWMSTRVLGQYDLLVGRDDDDDAVYMVGPNLAGMEQRFGFDPEEFRTWVLLHELTHRAQFTGVPWMKRALHRAGRRQREAGQPRSAPRSPRRSASVQRPGRARQQVRDSGVFGLIASPEQREVIQQIGGLMSLLEGHGDVTMSRAVGDLVPVGGTVLARCCRARRRRSNPLARLILRLTGIEGKLNQYAAGERFIAAIEADGGPRVVDVCWRAPANLPSLEEIREPAAVARSHRGTRWPDARSGRR